MAVPLSATDDDDRELEQLELELLVEGIHQRYGYDFRGYARASLRRRMWRRADLEGLSSLTGLLERVLHQPGVMRALLADLSINVTAMFRDPAFHVALRRDVFGLLRTQPFARVWVAGCSSGEEVVSLAISLREAGLLDRTLIYATDMDAQILVAARAAAYDLDKVQDYTRNYLSAGGIEVFSSYYAVSGRRAVFDPTLLSEVVFAQHNLATDRSFNEFDLILCRNVLIYFGRTLQERVLDLFDASLGRRGVLALGRKETLAGTQLEAAFDALDADERIYRRRA